MRYLLLILVIGWFFPAAGIEAAGKSRRSSTTEAATGNSLGKKGVAVVPLSRVEIELPGEGGFDFGPEFIAELRHRLARGGKYLVQDPARAGFLARTPDYYWAGSVVPSAVVKYRVRALNFSAGARGAHVFYGFDERFSTPFNAPSEETGQVPWKNEFPGVGAPRAEEVFGRSFVTKGISPLDTRSGLDVGEGFAVDFLLGGFGWQYRQFRAELRLDLEIFSTFSGKTELKRIAVEGGGFFFEIDGSYQGYSGGIELARMDALRTAIRKAMKASSSLIEKSLPALPLMARVDGVTPEGDILLGTGFEAEIPAGTEYFIRDVRLESSGQAPVIRVTRSVQSGAVARWVPVPQASPDLRSWIGRIVVENRPEFRAAVEDEARLSAAFMSGAGQEAKWSEESITLPETVIDPRDGSWLSGLFSSGLVQTLFLPYRIWRFFQYDQAYDREAGSGPGGVRDAWEWSDRQLGRPWARRIGLTRLDPGELKREPPIVAVIDSGIDYNHPALHDNLWLNPAPVEDFKRRKDRYGWDFISQDSRPYDDGYHGTEVASIVTSVAPWVRLMALKAFSPFGTTSSAALYASLIYAVDHGAELILCAWEGAIPSQALEEGIAYARKRGVLVVRPSDLAGLVVSEGPFEVAQPRGGSEMRSSRDFPAAVLVGALARVSGTLPVRPGSIEEWEALLDAITISRMGERGLERHVDLSGR